MEHGVGIERAQIPSCVLSQSVVRRQNGGLDLLTPHGDLDESGVRHDRLFVLVVVAHEVGEVDLGAKDGQRRASDVAQQRVSRRDAEVVVANGAMFEVWERGMLALVERTGGRRISRQRRCAWPVLGIQPGLRVGCRARRRPRMAGSVKGVVVCWRGAGLDADFL